MFSSVTSLDCFVEAKRAQLEAIRNHMSGICAKANKIVAGIYDRMAERADGSTAASVCHMPGRALFQRFE